MFGLSNTIIFLVISGKCWFAKGWFCFAAGKKTFRQAALEITQTTAVTVNAPHSNPSLAYSYWSLFLPASLHPFFQTWQNLTPILCHVYDTLPTKQRVCDMGASCASFLYAGVTCSFQNSSSFGLLHIRVDCLLHILKCTNSACEC